MKTLALSLIAIALVTGCSATQATPAPTVTVTHSEAPVPVPPQQNAASNEELYLAGLRTSNNLIIQSFSDSDLLQMGNSVCEALNAGWTINDVIQYMAIEMTKNGNTSDMETEAVGYIIGAASTALCPGANVA